MKVISDCKTVAALGYEFWGQNDDKQKNKRLLFLAEKQEKIFGRGAIEGQNQNFFFGGGGGARKCPPMLSPGGTTALE